ncbi:hypothetical protein BG004_001704, partial [Podila humilis]
MTSLASAVPVASSTSGSLVQRDELSKPAGSMVQPSPAQRMISACAGSLLTSLL